MKRLSDSDLHDLGAAAGLGAFYQRIGEPRALDWQAARSVGVLICGLFLHGLYLYRISYLLSAISQNDLTHSGWMSGICTYATTATLVNPKEPIQTTSCAQYSGCILGAFSNSAWAES